MSADFSLHKKLLNKVIDEGCRYENCIKPNVAITQMSDSISFSSADWFYMPEHIYDSPDIWTTFLSSKTEFSGFGEFFDSLENNSIYGALTDNIDVPDTMPQGLIHAILNERKNKDR